MSVLLGVLAAVCWGFSEFAGGYAAKTDSPVALVFWRDLIGFILSVALLVIVGGTFSLHTMNVGIVSGVLAAISTPISFYLLSRYDMSIVSPIAGAVGTAIPLVVSLLMGDQIFMVQVLGIVVTTIGVVVVLLSTASKADHYRDGDAQRALVWLTTGRTGIISRRYGRHSVVCVLCLIRSACNCRGISVGISCVYSFVRVCCAEGTP